MREPTGNHWPTESRLVFAHRGLNRQAPENTLPAFRKAAEVGAKWIETDVDLLRDGTTVIMHDSKLDRTTNRTGSVYELTADDLPGIDAGSWFGKQFEGTRLPTLPQVVDLMNETGLNANLELKPHETGKEGAIRLIEAVIEELERLDPGREVIISSFSPLQLAEFHKRAPQYAIGMLYAGPLQDPSWKTTLELVGASHVHPDIKGLTEGHVHAFRSLGYGVNVWTVNRRDQANELFNWGCTGVFTDLADELSGV